MLPGWVIFGSAIAYLVLLFGVASYGDSRSGKAGGHGPGRPLVYALSLAIYCTSWTYFGGVGLAAQRGYEFAAIYIGPILVFTLGLPLLRRITEIAKAERLTSILGIINVRNFPAIDPKMTFTPGRNVDFQPVIAEQSDKLLNCCSLSNSQSLIGFPFQCS